VKKPIRVLVVDDSMICREVIATLLNMAPDIDVVGKAADGREAIDLNRELKPDLITMDAKMPGVDGFSAISEIMSTQPVPIVMVTGYLTVEGASMTLKALALGALDIMEKPEFDGPLASTLREKVRLLAGVPVYKREPRQSRGRPVAGGAGAKMEGRSSKIVAIASSTGGPKALLEILAQLPKGFGSCILVTQRLPEGFSAGFAEWLNAEVFLEVHEAREGDRIEPGKVLVAPSGRHLVLRSRDQIGLSDEPAVDGHRPSGSLMFKSIARRRPKDSIGIVLSGIGVDGASGLLELKQSGGLCLAQNESSSLFFDMPKAAIEAGAVDEVLDIEEISGFLLRCVES
jgi:two-component system chemotaxis response regulator CheB